MSELCLKDDSSKDPYVIWVKSVFKKQIAENEGLRGARFGKDYDTLELFREGKFFKTVKVEVPQEILEEHLRRRKIAVQDAIRRGEVPPVLTDPQ